MTPSGTSTPSSRWARSTAIQSRRSATTLCSGDQISRICGRGVPRRRARSEISVTRSSISSRDCSPAGPRHRRALGDVGAVLGAVERDLRRRRRRRVLASVRERVADRGDSEHPPAAGRRARRRTRATVPAWRTTDAVERVRVVDAGDRVALARRCRGSRPPPSRRRPRRPAVQRSRAEPVERPGRGRVQQPDRAACRAAPAAAGSRGRRTAR